MEFNSIWKKEDNDLLRVFIRENKPMNYIREFFGDYKLFHHPRKKFTYLYNQKDINEIKYTPLKSKFIIDYNPSTKFPNNFDYSYKFQTSSLNIYTVDFIYLKDSIGKFKNMDLYNISFTLTNNRSGDYEQLTFKNEQHELIKRIMYIIGDFHVRFKINAVYLIGGTADERKIKWYRNIIKNSFLNVNESEDISSFTNGLPAYYYEIK